jgi:hypothetical protein
MWRWVQIRQWQNTFQRGIMESVNVCAIISSKTLICLQPNTHTELNIDSIKQKWRLSRRRVFPALCDPDYFRLTTRFLMQNAANVGQLRNSGILGFCICILFNQTWHSVLCNSSFFLEPFKTLPSCEKFALQLFWEVLQSVHKYLQHKKRGCLHTAKVYFKLKSSSTSTSISQCNSLKNFKIAL